MVLSKFLNIVIEIITYVNGSSNCELVGIVTGIDSGTGHEYTREIIPGFEDGRGNVSRQLGYYNNSYLIQVLIHKCEQLHREKSYTT